MGDTSGFVFHSLGYVAADKAKDKYYVEIIPIEQLPSTDGKITPNNIVVSNIKDDTGKNISNVVNKTATVHAKWIKLDCSNRINPPDVCKGETVFIYTFNGLDAYFWSTAYAEPDLRKRERAMYFWSSKASIAEKDWPKKGYSITVDTYDKYVVLHTSDGDGEFTTYDIELDTKAGKFSITDGRDNVLILNSAENKLQIKTNLAIELVTEKFSVTNKTGELLSMLSSFVKAVMDMTHKDSLKGETAITTTSKSVLSGIKTKIDSFIK